MHGTAIFLILFKFMPSLRVPATGGWIWEVVADFPALSSQSLLKIATLDVS